MTSANLSDTANHPEPEIIFHVYEQKCDLLKNLKKKKISLRQNLMVLCDRNENISKRLKRVKEEYETLKSDLHKALFQINVGGDKRKILSTKELNGYFEKRKFLKLQYQKSPGSFELEELIKLNDNLNEQCREITSLIDLTKKQYTEMVIELQKNFKQKVCEFCELALKLKAVGK